MAELLARISAKDLLEWMAYYSLEPFGEAQHEYRAGLVASIIGETARDDKKHPEPFKWDEFARKTYFDQGEEETDEEVDPNLALFKKAQAVFGKMGLKKKDG